MHPSAARAGFPSAFSAALACRSALTLGDLGGHHLRALLLATVGIYGVMSYAVTRRIHELGIRTALGASRREIVGLVLRQGMKPAAIGMAGGLVAALALTRFMAGMLYGVRRADPATLGAVILLLGGIALLACYIPARRATAIDPVVALRRE